MLSLLCYQIHNVASNPQITVDLFKKCKFYPKTFDMKQFKKKRIRFMEKFPFTFVNKVASGGCGSVYRGKRKFVVDITLYEENYKVSF